MKWFPTILAAAMSATDLASGSRVKSRKFPSLGHTGRILAESSTKLEVANASADSADALEFEHSALTELSGWPSVYPDFKTKFPPASKAVDDFKTANAKLNQFKVSTLPSSPGISERIEHYEGLLAAAEACQKAAEGAENACQAIIPDLQQALENAQTAKYTKQADAFRADVQVKKGMLARVTLLNRWSGAATAAKSAKQEAKAAAKAADDAEEVVKRINKWVFLMHYVAEKSHASAELAKGEKMSFEASWDPSSIGNVVSSAWAQRLFD